MRMWQIDPKLLCRQHLLGAHNELHMLVGSINRGHRLDGFIKGGLIEVHNIEQSHQEISHEMLERGYKHQSSLPNFNPYRAGSVDQAKSKDDLIDRCVECGLKIMDEF